MATQHSRLLPIERASRFRAGLQAVIWLTSVSASLIAADPLPIAVKCIGPNPKTGIAQAVIVENAALAYTAQFQPITLTGTIPDKEAEAQATLAIDHVLQALKSPQPSQIVKLNVYLTKPDFLADVQKVIARRFANEPKPAVSFVQTRLPSPEALVAMDAVGAFEVKRSLPHSYRVSGDRSRLHTPFARVAAMGNAPQVYVSGQAEKGQTLQEATTKTLAGLQKTLEHLGLSKDHVVQVKCFLTPMSEIRTVEAALTDFFGPTANQDANQMAPPCVFVEWQSSLPIEIELVIADLSSPSAKPMKSASSREPLEFLTPPGMTASPVFCRVVRVNDPRTIFVSGLFSREAGGGAAQVNDVFAQLQEILKASGSDLRHLAKATYYVSDNDASAKLNELRPKFYDPARPPAASKAQVLGVGMTGRTLTLDMIAVPAK